MKFPNELNEVVAREIERLQNSGAVGEDCQHGTVIFVALRNVSELYRPRQKEQKRIANNLAKF